MKQAAATVSSAVSPALCPRHLDPKHVELALKIALSFIRRLPKSIAADDVKQGALLGLLDALRRHPGGEGHSYDWYLGCRIRGGIIDELRRQDWLPRRNRSAVQKGKRPHKLLHLEDLGSRDGRPLQLRAIEQSPEDIAIARLDAAKALRTPMPPRDARVMTACFAHEKLQREVAVIEGVTEPRVSQLVNRSLAGMRHRLTGGEPARIVMAEQRLAPWQMREMAGRE